MGNKTAAYLLVGLLIMLALPVSARTMFDPDDVRGRLAGDVLVAARLLQTSFPSHNANRWRRKQCRRAAQLENGCSIMFVLDTKGSRAWRPTGRGVDHYLRWTLGRCSLLNGQLDAEVAKGTSRKGERSASCSIRRSKIDATRKIRWYVFTTWGNREHGWFATDTAPNQGMDDC
jgi:hypothetical protein